MHIQVLVRRLRVLHVAREGIEAIEAAGGWIVKPGASLRSSERASRAVRSGRKRQRFFTTEDSRNQRA